jgi:hypothetical protein
VRRLKAATAPSLECHAPKNPGLIVGVNNKGEYHLTGGTLKVNFSEIIGWGKGSHGSFFNQTKGTHKVSGNLFIAKYPDVASYNSFSLLGASIYDAQDLPPDTDKGLLEVGGFTSVGYLGYGEFSQEGGSVKIRGIDPDLVNLSLRTAYEPATPSLQCHTNQKQYIGLTIGRKGLGAYWLTDGELQVSRGEAIGVFDKSEGTFYHTSGSHYVGGVLTIGLTPGSKGLYKLDNGLLVARGGLVNNGEFTMSGGLLQAKVTNNYKFLTKGLPATLAASATPTLPTGTTIQGDFYNQEKGTLTLDNSKVKFGKNFYNSGIIQSVNTPSETLGIAVAGNSISQPTFQNLTINPTGILTLSSDKIAITGNLINKSGRPNDWHTEYADLVFTGPGTHYFKPGSVVPAEGVDPWKNNFAWNSLFIDDAALVKLQGNLVATSIDNIKSDSEAKITNMFGYCGINIFYENSNPSIEGKKLFTSWGKHVGTFQGGELIPACQ